MKKNFFATAVAVLSISAGSVIWTPLVAGASGTTTTPVQYGTITGRVMLKGHPNRPAAYARLELGKWGVNPYFGKKVGPFIDGFSAFANGNGYYSVKLPVGLWGLMFGPNSPAVAYHYLFNDYTGALLGAGPSNDNSYKAFSVKAGQVTHLATTEAWQTAMIAYHGLIEQGQRSQVDIFGLNFATSSTVTTDAPGVVVTPAIFTGYMSTLGSDRLRVNIKIGPTAKPGDYTLTTHSPLGEDTTQFKIFRHSGSSVMFGTLGLTSQYAGK